MKFPDQLANRLASTIATTQRLVTTAHQRLNDVGSAVSALQPGDWTSVTLAGGWSNMAGFIPAQVQFQRTGMALLVGHITGGSTGNGTVIGQLTGGYFNPVHAHAFTANVIAGAGAVAVTGTIAGASDNSGIANPVITGYSNWAGLPDGTLTGNTAYPQASGTLTAANHYHGGGTYAVTNGQHYHAASTGSGNLQVSDASHTHGATNLTPSTPLNYNTVTITVNTAGQISLTNCPAAATQLSFSEHLPLETI